MRNTQFAIDVSHNCLIIEYISSKSFGINILIFIAYKGNPTPGYVKIIYL